MDAPRIGLVEASKIAGCSVSAVRRWAQLGLIEGDKSDGKWEIKEVSLKAHLAAAGTPLKSRQEGNQSSKVLRSSDSEERLKLLNEALKREQDLNDELRRENKALQEEIKALLKSQNKGVISRWVRTISEVRSSIIQ